LFVCALSAQAQQLTTDAGRELLERLCSTCHAISLTDKSRHPSAPPFRDLMKRYKAELLAEALAEGLSTGHPDMPEFKFEQEQVAAIVEYLDSLAKGRPN
jgi:mono/diheme cytochrome c family protein